MIEGGQGRGLGGVGLEGEGFGESHCGEGRGGRGDELILAVGEAGFEIGRADGGLGVDAGFDVPGAVGGLIAEEPVYAVLELWLVAD